MGGGTYYGGPGSCYCQPCKLIGLVWLSEPGRQLKNNVGLYFTATTDYEGMGAYRDGDTRSRDFSTRTPGIGAIDVEFDSVDSVDIVIDVGGSSRDSP